MEEINFIDMRENLPHQVLGVRNRETSKCIIDFISSQ